MDEIEKKARELLAAEYETAGMDETAALIRKGAMNKYRRGIDDYVLRGIMVALKEAEVLRADKKEFAAEAVRWAEEAGRLKADLRDARKQQEEMLVELAADVAVINVLRGRAERAEALLHDAQRDAGRWRFLKNECTEQYGDGYSEPREAHLCLEWGQGSWIMDGSNGGRGRPDTFPGWDAIVDEMIARAQAELAALDADDAAMAAEREGHSCPNCLGVHPESCVFVEREGQG
ncbi:hypothetical protein [Xanthomonas sp. SHU 199]|uniref:hypothetical protein n=1 Tax=Xanthomonas sp. SHU 199 TaxID=1591174 RepID=UPI000585A510|nr:hypothetical protein [Xanthomonas sp. SHU 199]